MGYKESKNIYNKKGINIGNISENESNKNQKELNKKDKNQKEKDKLVIIDLSKTQQKVTPIQHLINISKEY